MVLALAAVMVFCSAAVLIQSDESDAAGSYTVDSEEKLIEKAGIANAGDTIVFSAAFSTTSEVLVNEGVVLKAGTIGSNQGLIIATTPASAGVKVIGCYATLNDVASAVGSYSDVTLIAAENSHMLGSGARVEFNCNLTVYGNSSILVNSIESRTGMEFTFGSTGSYVQSFYNLNNLKVWGHLDSGADMKFVIDDCDSVAGYTNSGLVMIRAGDDSFTGMKLSLAVSNCDIAMDQTGDQDAIHTVYAGDIKIENCTFTGINLPVNLNLKTLGSSSNVSVDDCIFTDCGQGTASNRSYSAPIRIVDSQNDGLTSVSVDGCAFNYSEGVASSNGDILIGDGREGKISKDVSLKVSNTDADIQYQQPGVYVGGERADESKVTSSTVTSSEILESTGSDITVRPAEEPEPIVPPVDDEDDYPFPPVVPVVQKDSDDSKKVIAVAVAAAAAAIVAIFGLMITKQN